MKRYIFASLLAVFTANTFAAQVAFIFSAPTVAAVGLTGCLNSSTDPEVQGFSCVFGLLALPFSLTTVAGVIILLKEEMKQASPDAYNFLAGEPMSDTLEALVQKMREQSQELSKAS